MQRIVITLEGGLITAIIADEDIEVLVLDFDTEGAELSDLLAHSSGKPAYVQQFRRTGTPNTVDAFYTDYPVDYENE